MDAYSYICQFHSRHEKVRGKNGRGRISTFDAAGRLVPETGTILALVKKYDMILASGHPPPAETFALIGAARHKRD